MAYGAMESTDWPSTPVPRAVKELLSFFFSVMDNNTPDAGTKLIKHVLTQNAKLINANGTLDGAQAIADARKDAYSVIEFRRHVVSKVYTCLEDASDMVLLGFMDAKLRNGKSLQIETASRAIIEGVNSGDPRISHFEVWADSGPLTRALQEE